MGAHQNVRKTGEGLVGPESRQSKGGEDPGVCEGPVLKQDYRGVIGKGVFPSVTVFWEGPSKVVTHRGNPREPFFWNPVEGERSLLLKGGILFNGNSHCLK